MQAHRNFVFGIPLISRAAARNWDSVQRLLSQTLQSILRQTDPDFRVLVAGNDRPDIPELADARVEFLRSELPIPETLQQRRWDKSGKRNLIAQRLRALGGGYLMAFDADDLVSARVVEWVRAHPAEGYLLQQGYCLDAGRRRLYRIPGFVPRAFDQVCGSCSILHLKPEDLPLSVDDDSYSARLRNHVLQGARAREAGRPLLPFPFAAVIYLINHDQNLTAGNLLERPRGLRRVAGDLLRRLRSCVRAAETARIAREFHVPAAYLRA